MTFETAMEKLGTLQRFGSPGAVERVAWILEQFGNPQHQLQFIHVAGTNGKGSTCAMLSSILREAGYQTGLFVSPYIIEFRERIQVNGEMIPKEAFAALMEQVFRNLNWSQCWQFFGFPNKNVILLYLKSVLAAREIPPM